MTLLTEQERPIAEAIGQIGFCNPFSRERIELERQILGDRFEGQHRVMSLELGTDIQAAFPNAFAMIEMSAMFANQMRSRILEGQSTSRRELEIYQDLTLFFLYGKNMSQLGELAGGRTIGDNLTQPVSFWDKFRKDWEFFFQPIEDRLPDDYSAAHAFAVFFQIERAFRFIFYHIHGSSLAIARLRADVWDSIFTQDMRAYARVAHRVMHEIPTLIQGESGTGKELVARAIGHAQYIPFDPKENKFGFQKQDLVRAFQTDAEELKARGLNRNFLTFRLDELHHPINLAGLVPNLIESELFGHVKGAFANAVGDKTGLLSLCPPGGVAFLDELGELDFSLQAKLLRTIQFREFHRVGEAKPHHFLGKFVAATNRDLSQEVLHKRFREDLYFRFTADQIQTCTLRDQIREQPQDLARHVGYISSRLFKTHSTSEGYPEEASKLAEKTMSWIDRNLHPDYHWPGNIRELEQCVRNVMLHNRFSPQSNPTVPITPLEELFHRLENLELTNKELISHYATLAYAREGSFAAAANRLDIDWKTLKSYIDEELLERLRRDRQG